MNKFDEDKLKLRRAFSLEKIEEEDDSWIASDNEEKDESENSSDYERKINLERRYSFPMLGKLYAEAENP
jgi:hypothetical protein